MVWLWAEKTWSLSLWLLPFAGIIVGSVTLTGIGLILAEVIDNLSGGYIMAVLVLTMLVSLVLGMGLPYYR